MKILPKLLALMLAGLTVCGALLSCRNDAFTIDDEERERAEQLSKEYYRTNKVTTTTKKPSLSSQTAPTTVQTDLPEAGDAPITGMLTPEQLYRELDERLHSHTEMIYRGADGEYETITLAKDGDLLEIDMGYESGARTLVSYYDFVRSIEYFENESGEWQVMPINPVGMTWNSLLVSLDETLSMVFHAPSDLFDATDDPHTLEMKEDALEAYGYGYLSYSYDPEQKTHSFYMQDRTRAESVSVTVDLMREPDVILPEVDEEGGGSNDPSLYTDLTPSALYTALTAAEDISITVSGNGINTRYEKDGGRLYLYASTDETDGIALYVDVPSGLTFAQRDDGSWTANFLRTPITWAEMLEEMLLTSDAYFFRDLNYAAHEADDRTLTVNYRLLEGSGISACTLERDGLTYRLTETYDSGERVVTTISFERVSINFPNV